MTGESNIRRQVGQVGVDTGQLFIVDPSYLDTWEPGEFTGEGEPTNSYARVTTFMFDNGHGEVERGVALGLDSDGSYPIFVVEDAQGHLLRIEIDDAAIPSEGIIRKQVGRAGVDTGQLFIVDPGYLDTWEPTNSYARVTAFKLANGHGEVEKGVVVSLDSGSYPVFVVENAKGYLLRIEIDLEGGSS